MKYKHFLNSKDIIFHSRHLSNFQVKKNSQSSVTIKAQNKCLLFMRGWAVTSWVLLEFADIF